MAVQTKVETLTSAPESELGFIAAVIRKSLDYYNSSWDMTIPGALMLGVASKSNPGMALYMLSVIDPQPNSIITDADVVQHFPLGFQGDWESTWNQFRKADEDQRAVFRR